LQEKQALEGENGFYRSQVKSPTSPQLLAQQTDLVKISPELAFLTKSRAAIASENQLYRAQLRGSIAGVTLTREQQLRLQSRQLELQSRLQVAQLEIGQAQEQLHQTQVQLASAKQTLAINQDILNRLESVAKEGAISKCRFSNSSRMLKANKGKLTDLLKKSSD
jgi:HlyD family secretion protein